MINECDSEQFYYQYKHPHASSYKTWAVLFVFVSCVGIIDPEVKGVRVAGTGNTLWADRRARKEACLLPDTTPDLLHALAVAPALLTPCVQAVVGGCYLPSKCFSNVNYQYINTFDNSRISKKESNTSMTSSKGCGCSSDAYHQITHT